MPTSTVIVVSVVILGLAALGKKGLGMLVIGAAVIVAVGSTVIDLDDRIPTAGDVASELTVPSVPDVDVN